jgi:imidazolonepropionase-like amidohydrolase
MTVEEMSVVVEEAHKVKATVACHAIGIEGIRNALAAGIDTLEHGTGMDDAAIETMIKQNVALVPTMSILHTIAYHGKDWDYPSYAMDNARHHYERHVVAVGRAKDAGVKIAAGTDVIDNDTVAMECAQLVKAGFTPMEAIVAATRTGAEIMNKAHDFGTLEVGRRADLVLLGANPLDDIKHLEDVQMVVKDGRTIDPPKLSREETLARLKGSL